MRMRTCPFLITHSWPFPPRGLRPLECGGKSLDRDGAATRGGGTWRAERASVPHRARERREDVRLESPGSAPAARLPGSLWSRRRPGAALTPNARAIVSILADEWDLQRAERSMSRRAVDHTSHPTIDPTVTRELDGTLVIRLPPAPAATAPDELIPFPFGKLERNAARALIRDGHLPAVKLGRKFYARRSDVLGLVDKLGAQQARRSPAASESADEAYLRMAGRR